MKHLVGILGLQGDFSRHKDVLIHMGIETRLIRWPDELKECDGLILPGGESTTLGKLLHETDLFEAIQQFGRTKPIMATCAGLILLSTRISNDTMTTMGMISITVERNGYGRQVDSFIDAVEFHGTTIEAVFIRAPKITACSKKVAVLARHGSDPVVVRQGKILACTFHPELTDDRTIQKYFIGMIADETGI